MSFEVSDCAAHSMVMKSAILLYGSHDYNNSRYGTIHSIDTSDKAAGPAIRAGRPLDTDILRQIVTDLLGAAKVRSGLLPSNILSIGLNHVIWWQPPGIRNYFFDTRKHLEAEGKVQVGRRAGTGFTPGLIFVAQDQRLYVFAFKGTERPDAKTPLFHAPLMNVYDTGVVCTGSMPIPDSTLAESVSHWERNFWASAFTHPNHAKVVNYKGGLHAFSNDLLDGKFRKFPERVLRRIQGATLGRLVDRLDAGRSLT